VYELTCLDGVGLLTSWKKGKTFFLTCCDIKDTISGSQCPNELTAMPAVKSRYCLFSTSHK